MSENTIKSDEALPALKTREQFRNSTLEGYVGWYWADGTRIQKKYLKCFWTGISCSLLATIFAAFPRNIAENMFSGGGDFLGWLVVVMSASATVANSTLVPRYKRMLDDRDKGRIRLDAASMKLMLKEYPEDVRAELEDVVKEIAEVEGEYGTLDKAAEKRNGPNA